MQTLLLGIVLAAALLAAVLGLLAWTSRHERLRGEVVARQIARADAVHERLGAVVALVIRRRRRGGGQVRIAVPFERPAVTEALLAIATPRGCRAMSPHVGRQYWRSGLGS
jgi:hypothetical protein